MTTPALHPLTLAMLVLGTSCRTDTPSPRDLAPLPSPTASTGDSGTPVDPCGDAPEWGDAQGYLRTWCLPCHSDTVAPEERQGAPDDVNFDTYAQVFAWRTAIEARATGPDADMPPVSGATSKATTRFAHWLECGALGTDDPPEPCDPLVPAIGAPAHIASASDAAAFCAAGNQATGDLVVDVDLSCLCDATGGLTAGDAQLPLVASVAGDLVLSQGSPTLPSLRHVGGTVTTETGLSLLDLSGLETVGGDVLLVDAGDVAAVDLSGLLTVDGRLELSGLGQVQEVDLSRLRSVGGALRLADLAALSQLVGLVAVESVGRGPVPPGGAAPGPDQGGIELVGLGALKVLDTFRLLIDLGGPVTIEGNPALTDIDGFTTLPASDHSVRVANNPQLTALEGFDLLIESSDLEVIGNGALQNVFGFANLTTAGVVKVEGSPALRSLAGLSQLEEVGGLRLVALQLQDVPWFTGLHTIDGDLVISSLPSLGRVSGLPALTLVGGDVQLSLNPQLIELQGPGTLLAIDGTLLLDSLPQLRSMPLLSGLTHTGNDLRVVGTDLVDLHDLSAMVQVGGDLEIRGNGRLPSDVADAFAGQVDVDGTSTVSDNGP